MKLAKPPRISASYAGSIVRYSDAQSARMPRRLNCPRCFSMKPAENWAQARRTPSASSDCLAAWSSFITLCSMGRPWQSQPGT